MKKLLILMLAGGLALSANAQFHSDNRSDHPKGRHAQHDVKKNRELEQRLAMIQRDYHTQIDYVKNNPHLRAKQKNKKIRQLEKERTVAINKCKADFSKGYREGYVKGREHHNKW